MKTVRFMLVVRKRGAPMIYLAWVDPRRDGVLKRGLAENRIMTLHQQLHGGKKDFGTVGYLKDRHAQILIFPKSLRGFSERRVIAIDYSLLAENVAPHRGLLVEKGCPRSWRSPGRIPVDQEDLRGATRKTKQALSKNALAAGSARAPARARKTVAEVLIEVKRAVSELAAGKSVPAYDRLKRILE